MQMKLLLPIIIASVFAQDAWYDETPSFQDVQGYEDVAMQDYTAPDSYQSKWMKKQNHKKGRSRRYGNGKWRTKKPHGRTVALPSKPPVRNPDGSVTQVGGGVFHVPTGNEPYRSPDIISPETREQIRREKYQAYYEEQGFDEEDSMYDDFE
jgi:hypothetical protein